MGAQFREDGACLVACPQGRMDAAGATDFAAAVEERLHDGMRSVTIDLDGLDHIDLGGVRAVLRLARSLKCSQRTLDFADGDNAVREALHQAGFDHLFAFTPPYHSHRGTS